MENTVETGLAAYEEEIRVAYEMNEARWRGEQSFLWCNHYDSFAEHLHYLRDFLTERIAFLDEAWLEGKEFCRVAFFSTSFVSEKYYVSVEAGDFVEVPEDVLALSSRAEFLGFFDGDGEAFDPQKPVEKNTVYSARWEEKETEESRASVGLENKSVLLAAFLLAVAVAAVCAFAAVEFVKKRRAGRGK